MRIPLRKRFGDGLESPRDITSGEATGHASAAATPFLTTGNANRATNAFRLEAGGLSAEAIRPGEGRGGGQASSRKEFFAFHQTIIINNSREIHYGGRLGVNHRVS
jgi:hypothetical protein